MRASVRLVRTLVGLIVVWVATLVWGHFVAAETKDFRLLIFIASLFLISVMPLVSFAPDAWSGRIPVAGAQRTLALTCAVTTGLLPMSFAAREFKYQSIFPLTVGVVVVVIGWIDRRSVRSHRLLNRVTMGVVLLASLTQTRFTIVVCGALLLVSAVSIDLLLSERFGRQGLLAPIPEAPKP